MSEYAATDPATGEVSSTSLTLTAADRDATPVAAGLRQRSFTPFGPFDIWNNDVSLEGVVERFTVIGVTEFIFGQPSQKHMGGFEDVAMKVIPAARGSV